MPPYRVLTTSEFFAAGGLIDETALVADLAAHDFSILNYLLNERSVTGVAARSTPLIAHGADHGGPSGAA